MRREYMQNEITKISSYRGLTILEMVLAMSITAVLFVSLVPQFSSIQNSWAAKQTTSEIIQNARVLTEHINRNLSKAVRVTAVSNSSQTNGEIVFEDNEGTSYKYGVSDNYVQFGTAGANRDLAGFVSQLRFWCYSLDDLAVAVTDVNSIRLIKVETTFTNPSATGRDRTFRTSVYLRTNGNSTPGLDGGIAINSKIEYAGSGSLFDSYNSIAGPYGVGNSSSNAIVTVNEIGDDNIILQDNAILYGDAYIGPDGDVNLGISTLTGAQITGFRGTLTETVSMPMHTAPTGPPFDGSHEGDYELKNSQTDTITSDRYFNTLVLEDDAVLNIAGDVTILTKKNFEIRDNAELRILADSSLNLYVKSSCIIENNAKVNANSADPSRLDIYMIGGGKIFTLRGYGQVHGVLQNTPGNVVLENEALFYGRIKAKRLDGSGSSVIHVDLDSDFGNAVAQILP